MIRDIGYIRILKTGPGTSVQDQGRVGYGGFGVPVSGALDVRSLAWVNHLLKNKDSDAVLEVCQPGLLMQFDAPTLICLAGAIVSVKLNGGEIPSDGIIIIHKNDQLEIGAFRQGFVLYLGIKQGIQSEKIMNSRSWYTGITTYAFAKKNSKIPYFTNQEAPEFITSKVRWNFDVYLGDELEAFPGSEWDELEKRTQQLIESTAFTISELQNRMAIQLTELLSNSLVEMATAPVFPGTVQLTSGGKLLILMKDAQVTGGYPRILQLTDEALLRLAQKRAGQKITFKVIN